MKNIEYYKNELSDAISPNFMYVFAITEGAKLKGNVSCPQNLDCEGFINWLLEEHQILDEVEKRYLGNIIRPLQTKYTTVTKNSLKSVRDGSEYEYIFIQKLRDAAYSDNNISLPVFVKGTMYNGMKAGEEYNLEELGL